MYSSPAQRSGPGPPSGRPSNGISWARRGARARPCAGVSWSRGARPPTSTSGTSSYWVSGPAPLRPRFDRIRPGRGPGPPSLSTPGTSTACWRPSERTWPGSPSSAQGQVPLGPGGPGHVRNVLRYSRWPRGGCHGRSSPRTRGPGGVGQAADRLHHQGLLHRHPVASACWRRDGGGGGQQPGCAGNLVVGQSWRVGRRGDQAEQLDAAEQESESEEEGCGRSCQGRGERGLPGLLDVGTKEGGLGPGPLQAVGPGTGSPGPRGPGPWLGWCSTTPICCIAVQLLL